MISIDPFVPLKVFVMHEFAKVEFETVRSGPNSDWSIRQGTFTDGLSAGIETIIVENGNFAFVVSPTRGMGVLAAFLGDERIGWNSPVKMPVHPAFVNLQSRNGLGWLDGFSELVCRCGLSSNGPPGQDESSGSPIESDLTLHGKIANLAAHSVDFIEDENGEFGVTGIVDESTLFGPQLRLETRMTTRRGASAFTIHDRVTNLGSSPTDLQLLYHTNVGSPFLAEGSRLSIPATRVIPRDAHAAKDADNYHKYLPPTTGYAEQCYFFELLGDESNRTLALLESSSGNRGVSVAFRTDQLPCFTQWKCTQAEADGYVTGLEPATNYPNFKSFERRHGRVVELSPGQSYETEITLSVHATSEEVDNVRERIAQLQDGTAPEILRQPVSPYCSID